MQRSSTMKEANGRWRSILSAVGVGEKQLTGKHTPCPVCSGKDRFRFDNKEGRGTFYCSVCGAGDGVRLVSLMTGLDIKAALRKVDELLNSSKPDAARKVERTDSSKLSAMNRTWLAGKPLSGSDPASLYLQSRGCGIPTSKDVRFHSSLPYRDSETDEITRHPAMISLVRGPTGKALSIHRTYLTNDGRKACVAKAKKLMQGKPVAGGAIRLAPIVSGKIGIAEGIETALAAAKLHGVPVWSTISAVGMVGFIPPEGVKEVVVFADNDESFTGQAAAYSLARRLTLKDKLKCSVLVPESIGDWNDVLREVSRGKANRAS